MVASPLRLALAQINPRVGDLAGNAEKILAAAHEAHEQGAQLVLFPELALTGYPPEDLLLKEHFLRESRRVLEQVAHEIDDLVVLLGAPERADDVYNALYVIAERRVRAIYRKCVLPNYGVFDEERYFMHGDRGALIEVGDARIGLTICEDVWTPGPPAAEEALAGATLIVNASASPYHAGKGVEREQMLVQRARDNVACVAFCNLVGGQDELVFDGHSLLIDHRGTVIARAPQFTESLLVATVDLQSAATARLRDTRLRPPVRRALPNVDVLAQLTARAVEQPERIGGDVTELLEHDAEIYAALVLGTRDYVEKNGFRHVVLGLSGGIDSTLVALIAVDALGADRVTTVTMPSPYSSQGTLNDARELARRLGTRLIETPIAPAMETYERMLADAFAGREPDLTEENLQARIRGNLLMALSNKFGWLVLTTGNKSEMAVGYSTLYGDSAGGFAVIKDVPKTVVYRLVDLHVRRAVQAGRQPPVPESIVTRPPSAELRPDQKDSDSLPAYETLDAILALAIEEDADPERLQLAGLPPDAIDRVLRLVDIAEYKRRQQPPGVKITPRAFGRDRRMPITNAYRPPPAKRP